MEKEASTYRYLFGPVFSRRYGRSLGVDMVEPKTCSFNCVFCQIGETESTTVQQQKSPPADSVIGEIEVWMENKGQCDVITLAGSGEPTLNGEFGRVLAYIRKHTTYPSLLLSNGSLFFMEDIRRQALNADIVKLSLHAWNQETFSRITRAHPSLRFRKIIEGYRAFRNEFTGRIDLEVFVVPGVNDSKEQMLNIAEIASTFRPDSVFLNTAVRPPAESAVKEASKESMDKLAGLFGDIAVKPVALPQVKKIHYSDEAVLQLTRRHPASAKQLTGQFDIAHDQLVIRLENLARNGKIDLQHLKGEMFVSSQTCKQNNRKF
ncbi:MAG: radical SAM protein [Kiritimatiellia bacterium]